MGVVEFKSDALIPVLSTVEALPKGFGAQPPLKRRMSNVHQGTQNAQRQSPQCGMPGPAIDYNRIA